ncbi:MAG: extracellular solute-binding protein [Spirochaetaceae bacterium]|nr:MAG: extracellular solute-binding protein [Spirochaetaceae bacterium]
MSTKILSRRLVVALLVLALVLPILMAAGGREAAEPGEQRIVFWTGIPGEAGPDALAEAFNERMREQGRNVVAVHERFVNNADGNTRLDTALLSGEQIDVYVNYNRDLMVTRIENGLAADLTPFIEANGFDLEAEFGSLAGFSYHEGRPYMLPAARAIEVVFYNKTEFDRRGITIPDNWTWSDYAEIALELTDRDAGVFGSMLFPWGAHLWERAGRTYFGGNWRYNDEGMSNLGHPVYEELLNVHYRMDQVDRSQMPLAEQMATRSDPHVEFVRGNVMMFGVSNAWVVRTLVDREQFPHDFVTAIAPSPRVNAAQSDYFDLAGPQDMPVIGPNPGDPELAWEFLQFFSTEGYVHHIPGGRAPGWLGYDPDMVADLFIGNNADLLDVDSFAAYYFSGDIEISVPDQFTAAAQLGPIEEEEYRRAVLGEISVSQAVQNAERRSSDAIRQARSR